ncbi:phosphotransferase [Nanchangia anserum]|uniref:Phosphotransferase n=2 Tax=Nanchangia anserum TaxID=2692125 RepID=A0A8I0KUX9_9ACTO|nr:phosphotransferase [Nanchangia anserum]
MKTSYSAPALAALITLAVPDADLTDVIGPVWHNDDVIAVRARDASGRIWVVWAPTSKSAVLGIESQLDVLAALAREHRAGHLLPAVPAPAGLVRLIGGGRALVAHAPAGEILTDDDLSRGHSCALPLAYALASLHSLDPAPIRATGMPDYSVAECRSRIHSEIDEAAESGAIPATLFDRWEAALSDDDLWRFTPRVVHGALSAECVWFDGHDVTALTDFSRVHVGDPAEDLAWVMAVASDSVLADFEDTYYQARRMSNARALRARATLMSEIALVRWLLHGVRTRDSEVIADARESLAALARAVGDGEIGNADSALATPPPNTHGDDTARTEQVDMDAVLNRDAR